MSSLILGPSTVPDKKSLDMEELADPEGKKPYCSAARRLIRRVIKKCETEQENEKLVIPHSEPMRRFMWLTGLQFDSMNAINFFNKRLSDIEDLSICRSVVQTKLQEMYLQIRVLPSTKQLYNSLQEDLPEYVDIGSFRKMLVRMGYALKRIHNIKYVVERPEVIYERFNYLRDIKNFRDLGRPIYYVDVNCFSKHKNFYRPSVIYSKELPADPSVVYAITEKAIVGTKIIANYTHDAFLGWIKSDLLPELERPSVIVVNKCKQHMQTDVETPTKDSTKTVMVNWLGYHEVPCVNTMSKSQLYRLIETFTDSAENIYVLEKILKAHHHNVLFIPDCINDMPYDIIFNVIKLELAESETVSDESLDETWLQLQEIIQAFSDEQLARVSARVAGEETKMLSLDLKVDDALAKLIDDVNELTKLDDEDSDSPSFSDPDDYF